MLGNVYFELTRAFNAAGPIAALASGQAVVYYRVAIMSKDGDWVIKETADACARILAVLTEHGAVYRPGAPLDTRWLAGGWSSHFEFADERGRRIRCDFFSRPPRVDAMHTERLFLAGSDPLRVIDIESLIQGRSRRNVSGGIQPGAELGVATPRGTYATRGTRGAIATLHRGTPRGQRCRC